MWLDQCLEDHRDSCPSKTSTLPTRVIDVGDESHPPKLYVTHHEHGAWFALSHCWGREVHFLTESRSLADRQQAMAFEDIPATFRDAILVTRRLRCQYLWIDSLCIIQDSLEDWARESSQMQHYYKNSVLTIATDHLTGDHESFLEPPRPQYLTSVQVPFGTNVTVTPIYIYIRNRVHLPGYENDSAPLNTRGWTLQENLLSPRTLHYAEHQVVFECQKYSVTESDLSPRGTSDADVFTTIKRFFLKPECSRQDLSVSKYPTMATYYDPIYRWYQIILEYYKRSLTFEDDRFAAISGLAREISQQSKMTYKAGIWVEDFHVGLLWNASCRGSRPSKYRAPSWSWASLDINMHWGQNINPLFELYFGPKNQSAIYREADMLEVDLDLADGDPYGRLLSGSLRLRGRWLPYRFWRGATPTYFATFWRKPMYHNIYRGLRTPDGRDQLICSFDEEEEEEEEEEIGLLGEHESENESESRGLPGSSAAKPDMETFGASICTHPQDHSASKTPSSENYEEQNPISSSKSNDTCSSTSEIKDEDEETLHSWDPAILDETSMLQIASCTSSFGERELSIFYALLLRPVVGQGDLGFRRVGIAEIPDVDGLGVNGWESKECTIVWVASCWMMPYKSWTIDEKGVPRGTTQWLRQSQYFQRKHS